MKLYTFDIPNEPAMLPTWLEGHLMGLHLRQLVTELSVLCAAASEPKMSLADVLGSQQAEVLQAGLHGLSRVQLRQLLRQPQLLLELQRLILDEGGEYWTTLPTSEEMHRLSRQTWEHVRKAMQDQPLVRPRRVWRIFAVSLAMAAAILLMMFAYNYWRSPVAIELAWSNPQSWPQSGRAEYLTFFADQAEAYWFADPPLTTTALARRLGELRKGCSVLIVQEHPVLGKEDRAWLKAKCLAWAKKLDAEQQRLETQGEPALAEVQTNVDDIVRSLAKALRGRSRENVG